MADVHRQPHSSCPATVHSTALEMQQCPQYCYKVKDKSYVIMTLDFKKATTNQLGMVVQVPTLQR